jgi:hypothetical protein
MDNATVIKLLTQQKEDIKDLMMGQSAVISARVDAKIDQKFGPIEKKVDSIVAHNALQNGWIQDHTLKLEANSERMDGFEECTDEITRVKKFARKRWYLIVAGIALIALITSWSYHNINLVKTLEKKLNIEIIDE